MANITRKQHKIFAGSATNNGQFGSLQAGTKITNNDPEVIQALAAYDQGWTSATSGATKLPALEELQGIQYNNSYQTAYILQKGIPEWDDLTDYHIGDIAREIGGSKLYQSLTNDNIGNTLTDVANWEFLTDLSESPATTTTQGQSLLPNPITIANNSSDPDHDIDFTAGNFQFDDGSGQAVATALTKQLDNSWAAGDNTGGLDTGTVAADTFYYCFAIYNPTTQTSDFLFSTSTSSPTMPSGYTKKKRIASLLTDGAGNIKNGSYTFFNGGYRFIYSVAVLTGTGLTPSYTTLSVSCPPFSLALIDGDIANNSTASYTKFQVGSKIEGDGIFSGVISSNAASRSSITPPFPIKVDSNSQIDSGFVDGIAAAYALYINGWIEYL